MKRLFLFLMFLVAFNANAALPKVWGTEVLKSADLNADFAYVDAKTTTGDIAYSFATSKSGWVMADAKTIGDGSSGASERANSDCSALFTLLWTNCADTYCPVLGGRGATAAADWAAHKVITLPDGRGRTLAGQDNMGGSAAGRITAALSNLDGTILANSGGSETVDISHVHSSPIHRHTGPIHTHPFSGTTTVAGGTTYLSPSGTTYSYVAYNHVHNYRGTTGEAGGGVTGESAPANTGIGGSTTQTIVQPTIIANMFIKL